MSKSDTNPKASIYLLDDPEEAYKKIMKAVTDSEGKIYLSDDKPGIKNLLTIYSVLKEKTLLETEEYFKTKNYGELKSEVGLAVKELLTKIQENYKNALKDVEKNSLIGAKKASQTANKKFKNVNERYGFRQWTQINF
ncbi:hypothetical protein [Mycoplasma struthionis]|uniref:hypothetical protein n=1 Tax=Mycoplasma struthionis TaxID=538220 RepID=UPI002FE1ADFA